MPQEPKRRHSTQRKGKRRASIKLKNIQAASCLNCGNTIIPHVVCKNCGYYKGKQVIALKKSSKTNTKSDLAKEKKK